METKPRWHYRFDNFKRAFSLLREAIALKHERALSGLEQEGLIRRFKYNWELAWKTLKDYLESEAIIFDKITPKSVIVAALEAKIIENREEWMQALDERNKLSHVYNADIFSQAIENIDQTYLALFATLYEKLFDEMMQGQPIE